MIFEKFKAILSEIFPLVEPDDQSETDIPHYPNSNYFDVNKIRTPDDKIDNIDSIDNMDDII